MSVIAIILIVLTSILLSFSYFVVYQYAFEKGKKEQQPNHIEINESNKKTAEHIVEFYGYQGGD